MKASGPTTMEFIKGVKQTTPDFFNDLRKKYGGIVRCKVPFVRPMYLLSHPDYAKYVLSHHAVNFVRQDFVSRRFRALFGNGSVVAEGDLWAQQRKIISPVFQKKYLENVFHILESQTEHLIEKWKAKARAGEFVEVHSEMQNLTLDMLWRVLFGYPTDGIRDQVFKPAELGIDYVGAPVPFYFSKWLPTYANLTFYFSNKKLENLILNIVQERRKEIGKRGDLLDFLLQYKNPETGQGLSDRLIVEEIKTMTPAGYLTTSAAVAWLFFELGHNPGHIKEINDECQLVWGEGSFDYEKMSRLKKTTNCLFEALRLHPTGWTIWRSAVEADEIGGYEIEPGATIITSPYTTHRNPDFWENPESFNPNRDFFSATDYSFFPFGMGPRKCLGENLAMIEMLIIVPMILKTFRFSLVKGQPFETDHRVILTPKPGVKVMLEEI